MGRPPIGQRAMTGAERLRKHRAKLRLRRSKPIARVLHGAPLDIVRVLRSVTLYDLLCAYAQTTNRQRRRGVKRAAKANR